MVCALLKPGELTNQEACTASVQFSVSTEKAIEVLDITVNQRSSDVMIGLPHDECCWSVILHLVRREVYRRCGRLLAAGKVFFVIAAGGAHVYDANKESFEKLRTRDPYLDVSPELFIKTGRGIFEMAHNFEREMVQLNGYHPHHRAIKIEQVV
jgi:thymidylate synthase